MRKSALESPTMGPFLFIKYTDKRNIACRVVNPVTKRVTTVSTANIVNIKK